VTTFRILQVEDSPADARMLQEALKTLSRPYQLDWVRDGAEALDFLRKQANFSMAHRPHLILMDLDMPRVGGLEALTAIKTDAEFSTIPIIMLSSSIFPSDVYRSYLSHTNSYVQKPTSFELLVRLVQAIESFWMGFAVHPDPLQQPHHDHSGSTIAQVQHEEASRAIRSSYVAARPGPASGASGCEEHSRLLTGFGMAVRELVKLHEDQLEAIIQGDGESSRFDILIHMANEKKQLAKYTFIRHVESHGCININAVNETRTRSDH
jgi:chemotaxis family two-component system response regulator Rcp1